MVINQQRLLYCTEFVSFDSLVFNAMQLPFVRTWHAFKSPALLRDDLVLCN